jgi:hypothetical protein
LLLLSYLKQISLDVISSLSAAAGQERERGQPGMEKREREGEGQELGIVTTP